MRFCYIIKRMFTRVKEFYFTHERRISSGALIFGFIVDSFTLTRADLWFDNVVLLSLLAISGIGIGIVNIVDAKRWKRGFFARIRKVAPLAIQFAFGGLFSGLLVLYSRSASLSSSWPFLLLLLFLLIGNEFFKERYEHITFQVSIYFVGLFSYVTLVLPIIVKSLGPVIFLLGGVLSLAILFGLLRILSVFIFSQVRGSRERIFLSVGSIFIVINVLYFGNIIPPIPLSLKESGSYHRVERVGDAYIADSELARWYDVFDPIPELHLVKGASAYFYSSVFAPTDIKTNIVHHWERQTENGEWETVNRVTFGIFGGRDGGYRGYSVKERVSEGRWRVNVETARGQVIGREEFEVIFVEHTPVLEQVMR